MAPNVYYFRHYLRQHGVHILIRYDGHALDVLVVSGHPVLVDGDVLGVQELAAGAVLAQLVLRGAAGVHEGLCHHTQARVHDVGLAQVKHKVWVLDQVHPEPGEKG